MTTSARKRDPLSRYFKDLDSCESDSSDGEDENGGLDNTGRNTTKFDTSATTSSVTKCDSGSQVDNSDKTSSCSNVSYASDSDVKLTHKRTNEKSLHISNTGSSNVKNSAKPSKLPSAAECLSSHSTPAFLKLLQEKEVNWAIHEKHLNGEDSNTAVSDFKNNAVPPPSSYEPQTDPGIKVVDSEGRKRKRIEDDLEDQRTSTKAYKVSIVKDEDDS